MKIAIFSDNFYPELSGITDSIITSAKELARRGHEIMFVVPEYSDKDYKKVDATARELDLGGSIDVPKLTHPNLVHGQSRQLFCNLYHYTLVRQT